MLKVGVVGLGVMGQHHARLYSQFQNGNEKESPLQGLIPEKCELVAVADTDPGRAAEIGDKYHVPHYTDYHALLSRVDAVSIAVPTTMHHEVAMDFLDAGIHCLVEKPIAFRLEETEDMIQTASARRVNLAIGHIERFNPAVVKLKEIVEAGILGQILIISTRRVGPYVPRIRDVGVVIDSATHDIGVVKYLIGQEPSSVFSRVGSLKHPKEDHAIIVLDFNGPTACIEVNWFTPHKVRTLVATGSEGIAYLDYIEQTLVVHNTHDLTRFGGRKVMHSGTAQQNNPDPQREFEIYVPKAEPLMLEIADFLKSVMLGYQPAVNGDEGQAILKIALESSRNNYVTSSLS